VCLPSSAGVALGPLVALVLPFVVLAELAEESIVGGARQNNFFVEQWQDPVGLLVDQVQDVLA